MRFPAGLRRIAGWFRSPLFFLRGLHGESETTRIEYRIDKALGRLAVIR